MNHAEYAARLFAEGYNCSQAVFLAFAEDMGMDRGFAARLVSPFGGGMGRMREVCGAVTGMYAVLGVLYGYEVPGDDTVKKALYTDVQALAAQFRETHGSIICREILKNPPSDPTPSPRTEEYYRKRPCARMAYRAAEILEGYIAAHPIEK